MSISPVIDDGYRLKPADVGRATMRVTINNVSLQGVEELSPVLHLVEFPTKRLVIDGAQGQVLMQLTGSPLLTDWIGQQIDLKTSTDEGESTILIQAPQAESWPWKQTSPPKHESDPGNRWTSLLLLVVLIVIFGAAYALDNGDAVWQVVKHLLLR